MDANTKAKAMFRWNFCLEIAVHPTDRLGPGKTYLQQKEAESLGSHLFLYPV